MSETLRVVVAYLLLPKALEEEEEESPERQTGRRFGSSDGACRSGAATATVLSVSQ